MNLFRYASDTAFDAFFIYQRRKISLKKVWRKRHSARAFYDSVVQDALSKHNNSVKKQPPAAITEQSSKDNSNTGDIVTQNSINDQ